MTTNSFSSRLRQFTDRLKTSTRIDNFFAEQSSSEGQALAKDLQAAGECVSQLSQVVMEVEILNQLHSRLVYEKESLQQEKADLETNVFELQQERNEIEPQVMYLREQLSQASIQLEQTQNRERNLSDRERQLTDIVAQLERRRAVLNQTIENLTNQEADYIVRTQELGKIVEESEKKAQGYIDAVNYYQTWLNELKAQVEEEEKKLKAMGIEPPTHTPPEPEPLDEQYLKIPEPSYMPHQPAFEAYEPEEENDNDYWDVPMPPPPEPVPDRRYDYPPPPSSPFNEDPWA